MRVKASLASRLLCVVFLLLFSRTAAAAGVIYVDADAAGANDGKSWENAYVYLQDALADANSIEKPIEIRVAQGIYTPDSNSASPDGTGSRKATFQLINNVTIKGGYAGFGETDPNARDIEAYETILSGDLNGDNIDINDPGNLYSVPNRYDNSEIVVTGSNTDSTALLDGLTITGGYISVISFSLGGGPIGGAGMLISSGSPTLIDCTFTDNVTSNTGGGLLIHGDSNPTLSNCKFMRNYAESGGGIFSMVNNCLTLTNCTFSDNYALHKGGGMYHYNGNPKLTNCTFSRNSVYGRYSGSGTTGGGMYNRDCSPSLTNCIFSANSSAFSGGGLYNRDCNTVLNMCEFVINTSSRQGSAILNSGGQLIVKGCIFRKNYPGAVSDGNSNGTTFTNCIFSGNSSPYNGGAVHVTSATFNHCIFAGNTALRYYSNDGVWYRSSGGAVYSILNSTFNNCTFDNNWADYGCALYCYMAYVNNCIFWGSEDQIRPDSPDEEIVFVEYSNIQGGSPHFGKGNIDTDPCFVDPGYWADADDPNVVAEPNDPNAVWIDGDYHLKSQAGRWDPVSKSWVIDDVTSPCIDAGDPNSPVAFEKFPNGGIINMGAYGGTPEASMSPSGIHAKYGGGTGEPNDPYMIYTAEQMNVIGAEPNNWDKHFKLMADIDLSGYTGTDFNIIGISGRFKGVFDGNGHTISNFSYTSSNEIYTGLFRYISGQSAQIKDLGLIAPEIDAEEESHVGSLVGCLSLGTITNCYVEGGSVSGKDYVGGLVGLNHGNLNNCYSTCNVSGKQETGGLVGYNNSTTITNCFTGGEVFGRDYVGGLAGSSSGTIKNSFATGNVTAEKRRIVTRENRSIGGLIGRNSGPLISCSAGGDVSGDVFVGGLVGNSSASIINCYATGSVLGTEYVGGLAGTTNASIADCYAIGGVSGTTYVGGLVGYKGDEGIVSTSFWNIETCGQSTSAGGIPKTTAEMQTIGTFLDPGWDFVDENTNGTEDIWWILEGQDYPRLWWELINNELLDN